ncbi:MULTISPECIES: CopG family antitoxin [Hallerella]|uniref:CopG family antitoxin n=1 Tax=Hallerella TaxID=2815788 RepID=UPI000D0CE76A|nr:MULTISPECIES: CopG family antitoxin [Hallerella]MCI6872614.1 hypothetical protein [Hallerella sp.]MDY5029428.1 hypothetical protein [Hallerella succinigenes]
MAPKRKSQKRKHPKGFKLVKDIYSPSEIEALENDTHVRSPMTISGGHESETLEESLSRIKRAIAESKEEKKMYSIRLKVKTVDAIKRKASAAGIPYQTYINALLDNAALA